MALGAYSFSSPRFVMSIESMQDLEQSFTAVGLAKRFFADRLARGIGNYLINGTGSGQPTGLLTALESVPPITAQGSAANTGGSESGAISLGSVDFATAHEALDAAYLASPKCAWAMSNKTLGYLLTIVDKYGNPLRLVQFVDGAPTIYGKKVIVCPSMPSVGPSQIPVVLEHLFVRTPMCFGLIRPARARSFKSATTAENLNLNSYLPRPLEASVRALRLLSSRWRRFRLPFFHSRRILAIRVPKRMAPSKRIAKAIWKFGLLTTFTFVAIRFSVR